MSTSTATAYKYSVVGHLSFGAPKCEKAQKSSGFWANRTYRLCIKDNVLIDATCSILIQENGFETGQIVV